MPAWGLREPPWPDTVVAEMVTYFRGGVERRAGFEDSGRGPTPAEQERRSGVEGESENQHSGEPDMHREQAGHHSGHHRRAAVDAPSPRH